MATDPKGASLYADDKGRREGWVAGAGTLTDGYCGSEDRLQGRAGGGGGNRASFADANGGRFITTCPNGCSGTLKAGGKVDTFDISGAHDANIVGRAAAGRPGPHPVERQGPVRPRPRA